VKNFFGATLLGCGILIAGLSGLCGMLFLGGALFDSPSGGADQFSILPAVLLIAGIPLGIGIGMIFGGRAVIRSADEDARGKPYDSAFNAPPTLPASPVLPAEDKDPLR
jgi:hypothetical protein